MNQHILFLIWIVGCSVVTVIDDTDRVFPQGAVAFAGAEGPGVGDITGGRGKPVHVVTSLSDSGSGSFRAALAAAGDTGGGIIVFNCSGVISLASNCTLNTPDVTIAMQTSPSGIVIAGASIVIAWPASNIIWRGGAIARGPGAVTREDVAQGWCLQFRSRPEGVITNVIFDHISLFHGTDTQIGCNEYGVNNFTVQWSMLAQPFNVSIPPHPTISEHGYLWNMRSTADGARILLHHSFLGNASGRAPKSNGAADSSVIVYNHFVNNIIYNVLRPHEYGNTVAVGLADTEHQRTNFIGNHYMAGPDTPRAYRNSHTVVFPRIIRNQLYVSGNHVNGHPSDWGGAIVYLSPSLTEDSLRADRMHPIPFGLVIHDALTAADLVAAHSGAVPRDSLTARMIREYETNTGAVINEGDEGKGRLPVIEAGTYRDSDGDGMPDWYESDAGFDIGIDDSALDSDGDGYTNIEEFLNGPHFFPQFHDDEVTYKRYRGY